MEYKNDFSKFWWELIIYTMITCIIYIINNNINKSIFCLVKYNPTCSIINPFHMSQSDPLLVLSPRQSYPTNWEILYKASDWDGWTCTTNWLVDFCVIDNWIEQFGCCPMNHWFMYDIADYKVTQSDSYVFLGL